MSTTTAYPPPPRIPRDRLPPGPPELPVVGQTFRYLRDPIGFMQQAAAYGDLVTLSVKPALLYLATHPDLIRDLVVTHHRKVGRGPNTEVLKWVMGDSLVTADGPDHLQQRRLMQPHFHHTRIDAYAALMQQYAAQHSARWHDGQHIDLAREMGDLTLRIVVKTLFGLDLPADANRLGAAFEFTNNYLVTRVNQPPRLRHLLHRLPLPYTRRFRQARARLDEIIFDLIAQRRQHPVGINGNGIDGVGIGGNKIDRHGNAGAPNDDLIAQHCQYPDGLDEDKIDADRIDGHGNAGKPNHALLAQRRQHPDGLDGDRIDWDGIDGPGNAGNPNHALTTQHRQHPAGLDGDRIGGHGSAGKPNHALLAQRRQHPDRIGGDPIDGDRIDGQGNAGQPNDDLLSLLLRASFEDDAGHPAPLTDQQVRDQTITLFAAGHETTAVCLTWTWYLLATHPEIQTRFHQELDAVLAGRPPTLDDLPNLPFTDCILTESLRLYPSIWFWSRMAFQPFTLGGYDIPAGAVLAAPQLIVQRDPRWFDAPLSFQPDRWTPEFRRNLPRYAYYPFGGGPRQCIGEGFAWMEAKLILATIGQKWAMRHDPRHRIKMLPLISLRPQGGMPMYLQRRR